MVCGSDSLYELGESSLSRRSDVEVDEGCVDVV